MLDLQATNKEKFPFALESQSKILTPQLNQMLSTTKRGI